MKELLEKLRPLLKTNAMFGTFALGDGSCYFCAACGRRSEGNQPPIEISHKEDCGFVAHGRAKEALRLACLDAGMEL